MSRLVPAGLVGLIALAAPIALPQCWAQEPSASKVAAQKPNAVHVSEQQHRELVTVLLSDANGEAKGSGVVVGTADGGQWIATNRHVVGDQKTICLGNGPRSKAAAFVVIGKASGSKKPLDLALVWLPRSDKELLSQAVLAQTPTEASKLPLVVSTGYPTPLQKLPDGRTYTEKPGLLVPLLSSPLEGGFDLAYTSTVEKGMSGGGVFIGGVLIGINGAHANPLWPGQWNDQRGKPVDTLLNQKLELVSLGLSITKIQAAMKAAVPPNARALQALDRVRCH